MTRISSFWIGDALSPLERACVQSFLAKGHDFHLYCYGTLDNVPDGCRVRDAATILPQHRIIRYVRGPGKGSVTLFSNMFRYKLLHEHGGWWVDMDMFCLADALPDAGVVLSQEDERGLNCAIMRFPAGHAALQAAYDECVARNDDVDWGDVGPRLLTRLAQDFALTDAVFAPNVFYPIHYSQFWCVFDPRRTAHAAQLIQGAATLHLWNNLMGRAQIDKNVLPPAGSLLRQLYEWTIGTAGFEREYVLAPSCAPDALELRVVDR